MEQLHTKSLILGILLSVNVVGLYESVFYLVLGKTSEANAAILATISILAITMIYVWPFFLRGHKASAKSREDRKEEDKAEETEEEKLKREFQQRMIT